MPFENSDRTSAERLAAIEESQKHLATKEWVQEIFHPIQTGQSRIESALAGLTEKVSSLFAAHDEFLKEQSDQAKAKREEEKRINDEQLKALKERGFMHWISNVGTPALTFMTTAIGFASVVLAGFLWWLSHVQ